MADREADEPPKDTGAAELRREGEVKEGNFVSIKVLGQAIESVGKGGLPDQIDLDALLKAVQRYKQEEGPKEVPPRGLNSVIPLPTFCPSVSGLGKEVKPVKPKPLLEPSQKIEHLQMGSVVDGLPLSATIAAPGTIPMNSAIIPPPLAPMTPVGQHPVLFGTQIRTWPCPEPLPNMHHQLQVPMTELSAAGLSGTGIMGAINREPVVLNAPMPMPAVGVIPGHLPSEAQSQMPTPSMPIRNRMVSRRGPLSKSSPYRGVSCYKRTGRWESHIWHAGRQLHLGTHSTPEEAARVYDIAAIKLRGWGADLNFGAHTYRDDPQLKDLTLHCNKKTEEADVAKLVKGLKRRKGSGAKATKTKTAKLDVMPENLAAQPSGDFVPYATEQGLNLSNVPRTPVAPMFFRHPLGQSMLMGHNPVMNSPTASRRLSNEALSGFVDANGAVAPGIRIMESSPSMVAGSMPVVNNNQQQQQAPLSNGPPALFSNEPPMTWAQEHPPGTAGASQVTPSRVISLARSPTFRQANVQAGMIKPAETNNHLVWTSMIPNSPGVRVVLDNKAASALGCQGEYILEGKPMPIGGHGMAPPGISAFWPGSGEVVNLQGQMTNRDQTVACQAAVGAQQSLEQKGIAVGAQGAGSTSTIVPPGPVHSLQSVLQGVTTVGQQSLGATPVACTVTAATVPSVKPAGSTPPSSQETRAPLGDSQQRFAKLLQLIHELPAKAIVRQGMAIGKESQPEAALPGEPNKEHNPEGELGDGNMAFAGGRKLRAINARSAFKNWTSSDSGEMGKSSDDGQGLSGGQSPGHSGSANPGSNKSNSNGNGATTCCSSGKGEQLPPEGGKSEKQADTNEEVVDQADAAEAGIETGVDPCGTAGTLAEDQGNKRLMEDDLLAAQQLCQLSQMVGPGSSSGNSANMSGGRKRICSGPPPTGCIDIPAWQNKRQRTILSRQGRKDFLTVVEHTAKVEKGGNASEQVLSNSGKGNKQICTVDGPSQECEELGGPGNQVDVEISVAGCSEDKGKVVGRVDSPGNDNHGWKLEVEEGDNNSKTSMSGMECVGGIDEEIQPLMKDCDVTPISCGPNGVLDVDCHHQSGLWGRTYPDNTTSGSGTVEEGQEKDGSVDEEEIGTLERVPEVGVPFPMQMSIINE